ncbi:MULTISPECIES: hypothetical protein [unclassified Chryseobacterium]|uniref:hypothetical protein n=1 Tax=unclassified Chryseobacterium TaxID=2593645 RepID=UPI000B17BC00|nr:MULTISPECIES: hypothetical protein [unclassified Chryseobacterium]
MIPQKSISAVTGKSCPAGGIWESTGNFKTTITMTKGSVMPDYCGTKVQWILILKK